ncbi:MAG: hypothetical protein FJ033_12255 [Chloroflexi bacterium]|nr:hypothetical protein [Chloroflexota bacterium]
MRILWWCLTVGFLGLNIYAFATGDFAGLVAYLGNLGPWGILATVDLVLALGIGLFWMVRDARSRRRSALPYVVATCLTGSLGLLFYLAMRAPEDRTGEPAAR